MDLNAFAVALKGASTPLLLAAGAVLALTSVRNAHLSDRARQNVDEWLYKVPGANLSEAAKFARRANLDHQNRLFILRYQVSCFAFFFTVMALILMATGAAWTGEGTGAEAGTGKKDNSAAAVVGVAGITCFVCGLALLMLEFVLGPKTLTRNNETIGDER